MQKLIMFNGPPRSGKDTAAKAAVTLLGNSMTHVKFTDEVKRITHENFGIHEIYAGGVPNEHFEPVKDTPMKEFGGLTPRQAYIATSTQLKKDFGEHVVSDLLKAKLQTIDSPYVVNTDVGFDFEGQMLIDHFGPENVMLIRIHRDGKVFTDDCRNYVDFDGITTIDLNNNVRTEFMKDASDLMNDFVHKEFAMAMSV